MPGGQVSFHMTMTQPVVINSYYCGWFYFLLGTPTKGQNLSQRRNGWCPEIKDFVRSCPSGSHERCQRLAFGSSAPLLYRGAPPGDLNAKSFDRTLKEKLL